MRMYTFGANSLREIMEFANANGIAKENIVDVFQTKDGDFMMIYYGE